MNPYGDFKIAWHTDKLLAMAEGEVTPPLGVLIQPTNKCNHRCFYCSYMDKELGLRNVDPRAEISPETMSSLLTDIKTMKVKSVIVSGGGEPLLYPKIVDMLRFFYANEIKYALMTNGQLLTGEVADILRHAEWVRISMDCCDGEMFKDIRNSPKKNFYIIEENIERFSRIKDEECILGINYVIHHKNHGRVYESAHWAKDVGADNIKFTARVTSNTIKYHEPFKASVIGQIEDAYGEIGDKNFLVVDKYSSDFERPLVFFREYKKCYMMQVNTVVAADSKVYMCHDKSCVKNGILGDLKKASFKDIWYSDRVQKIFKTFDAYEKCRQHCVHDDRNMIIHKIVGSYDHKEFV